MAPIQGTKRPADEPPEERPPKRLEALAAAAALEELDDDEGSQWSDGEPQLEWKREDFLQHPSLPVELSEEDVAKFNAAYMTAQLEWARDENRVLVTAAPLDVRPVPLTVEQLKERMPSFRLSDYGVAQRLAFDDALDSALLEEEEDEDEEEETEDENADPQAQDAIKRGRKVLQLLQTYAKTLAEEKVTAQKVQIAVVVTHGLLDACLDEICDDPAGKAELIAFLGALAKVWSPLLKQTAEALGISDSDRRGVDGLMDMIHGAINDDTFIEGALKGAFEPRVIE